MARLASSDDEAPEEESLQVSQRNFKQRESKRVAAARAEASNDKKKRRARDEKFKQQKRLLSEILAEEQPEAPAEQKKTVKTVKHTVKKLEAEKQGFKLKVHKATTKLPTSSQALLARKERFLKRKRH